MKVKAMPMCEILETRSGRVAVYKHFIGQEKQLADEIKSSTEAILRESGK